MHTDVRVGGAWQQTGIGRDGEPFTVSDVYRVVEPLRLLEFTWLHDWSEGSAPVGETVVRYELDERDGVTQVHVTHRGFPSVDDRDNHASGWKMVLAWLRSHAER